MLRAELAASGVQVTLAAPGLIRTGSVRRVRVRGQHEAEARWFAALSATSLTAKNATATAREILDAARHGRASVTPGWQAQVLVAANVTAPDVTAATMATVTEHLLPAPVAGPSPARTVDSLDLGWARGLVSETTAAAYNQL